MCAHAVRVAVEKLPGVEMAEVSLNEGFVDVRLDPENTLTLARLRTVIREQGFSPEAAVVVVKGELIRSGDGLVLITPAWDEPVTLELGDAVESFLPEVGGFVALEGHVSADDDTTDARRLRVTAVR